MKDSWSLAIGPMCGLALFAIVVLSWGSAVAAPWEVPIDGPRQHQEVQKKLAAKRKQIAAIEPVVTQMWNAIYQVNLSEREAKVFTNLVTPERVDYWVQLEDPQFNGVKMTALYALMKQPWFQSDDPEARFHVTFNTPSGSVTWILYPEAYDVLVKSTQDLRLPFVCRVVLLDSDNAILAMANEYLNLEIPRSTENVAYDQYGKPYALTRKVDFDKPVLFTWLQVAEQALMERLGNKLSNRGFKVVPGDGGNVLAEMGGMSGSVKQKTEEAFYAKDFKARQIRFWGLPTDMLSKISRLRVLRPSDTLLLYKGLE